MHAACTKDLYFVSDMWLQVATDTTGFYDGCDEWAMKVPCVEPFVVASLCVPLRRLQGDNPITP